MMYDLVAIGEVLIDFAPAGVNEMGMQLLSQNPGGAPANVLAMYAKLGGQTAFIGKVGQDAFGSFLTETLKTAGIDTAGLVYDKQRPTTLAFVHLDQNGERTFSFYRNHSADTHLTVEDLSHDLLACCRVFHFGGVSLTDEPSRTATLWAVKKAKEHGAAISYDPNYRPALWASKEEAVRTMKDALKYADIIKVSREEMTLLTNETDVQSGAALLLGQGAAIVLVTDGEKGAYYQTASCCGALPSYHVPVVDTTGAGDAFLGAFLYQLKGYAPDEIASLPNKTIENAVRYASAAGGMTTTAKGAMPAMPDDASIRRCMETVPFTRQ